MEATYYKDTMRSYMIIPCPEEAETESYQYRMLEMNRIPGLLACGLRHIDGERFLYYDITGRQSMQSLYEGRKISGAEFFHMIRELDRVSESISRYLLDEQHLVLSQQQIFYDLQTGDYHFTYYPGESRTPEVFRFLADSIDGTDKSAAAAAYRLSSVARGDWQALREAIREEAAEKEAPSDFSGAFARGETHKESQIAPQNARRDRRFQPADFIDSDMDVEQTDLDREPSANIVNATKKRKRRAANMDHQDLVKDNSGGEEKDHKLFSVKIQIIIRVLLILIAMCGAGGLVAAQFLLYISHRERRLCIAGAILLATAAILITVEMALYLKKERNRKQEEEKNATPVFEKSDEEDLPRYNRADINEYRLMDEENGNTVQLSEQEQPGRLYGQERGNRIDLRTLPVTVGKAQAYADIILSDPSISRVHARIYKGEDGSIEIRDLDSTNGTWINGVRLMPNEKKAVHRGDEVRFGNMEYEYR